MTIRNVHERVLPVPPGEAGVLLDGLAGPDDRLWPSRRWPALRLDRPLSAGAAGGHGPVRYTVVRHVPGALVAFRFRAPRGLDGEHRFELLPHAAGSLLRHVIEGSARGRMRLLWPLAFRPLHDASWRTRWTGPGSPSASRPAAPPGPRGSGACAGPSAGGPAGQRSRREKVRVARRSRAGM